MKPHRPPGTLMPTRYPFNPAVYEQAPGTVLVVAPHPDDDVIGAGGMMALLAHSGRAVFSLYVTDGTGDAAAPVAAGGKKTLAAARQREALEALNVVKARGAVFLNYRSRELTDTARSFAALRDIRAVLAFFRPEAVYVPAPFERHRTHRAVLSLTLSALRSIRGYAPQLFGYRVWAAVCGVGNLQMVDISSVVHVKKKAIRKHASQIAVKAYDEGILALNRYEAVFAETHGPETCRYREVFLDMQQLVIAKKLSIGRFVQRLCAQAGP